MDPEVAALIVERERWRHDKVQTVTARLARQRMIRPPFTRATAAACIGAATAFPCWDAIAEQTARPHNEIKELMLQLLLSVVRGEQPSR